jgi:hypothetical protein
VIGWLNAVASINIKLIFWTLDVFVKFTELLKLVDPDKKLANEPQEEQSNVIGWLNAAANWNILAILVTLLVTLLAKFIVKFLVQLENAEFKDITERFRTCYNLDFNPTSSVIGAIVS